MFSESRAFTSFSSNDIPATRTFYADTLGLPVTEEAGGIMVDLPGAGRVLVYPKDDHRPATFTVLNFPVDDIEAAVDRLIAAGVTMERYEGFDQDDRGIMRSFGPAIAWFTDPVGNIISVLEG